MTKKFNQRISRRNFLKGTAAGAAMFAATNPLSMLAQTDPTPTPQPLPEGTAGTLSVIHRTEYFEEVQTLFRDTVVRFAETNNVGLDISTANPEAFGDFLGRLQAAVEAGNPPDIAYTSNVSIAQMQLLGLLEDVSDVVEEAISRYGNIMPGTNADKVAQFDGAWFAIPFIANTTGYFIRGDKLDEIGVSTDDLATFEARREAALAMSDPDNEFWGWGLTPAQSGDGWGFLTQLIMSFGGHFTDETGLIVQYNSPETVAAVEWLAETYNREGMYAAMIPPGVESWGDISNNEAYLAGTIGYTHNAFSVYAQAKRDENPVYPVTRLLLPGLGPANLRQEGGAIGGWLTIHRNAPNIDLAKQLALDLLDPANFTPMSSVGGGLVMPAYQNLWTPELIEADPNFAIIQQQVSIEEPFIGASWPAQPSAAIDAIRANGIVEQMVGNVIAGRMTPAEAVENAHNQIVDLFEEGGIEQP
jgi:multiple sugar transport system substrate-binding protein